MVDTFDDEPHYHNFKPKKKLSRRSLVTLAAIIMSGLVAIPTAMVFIVGMLPTIVAFIIDKTNGKTKARTVGFSNLVGVFVVVMDLWKTEHSIDYAFSILLDPYNWLYMYLSAAVGWGINIFFRWSAKKYIHARGIAALKKLRKKRYKLETEYGPTNLQRTAPELPFSLEDEDAIINGEKTANLVWKEIKKQRRLENPDMYDADEYNDDDEEVDFAALEEEALEMQEIFKDYQDILR